MLLVTIPLAFAQESDIPALCGNTLCEPGENPATCSIDCKLGPMGYALCAFDETVCVDEETRKKSLTAALVIIFVMVMVYLKRKKFF